LSIGRNVENLDRDSSVVVTFFGPISLNHLIVLIYQNTEVVSSWTNILREYEVGNWDENPIKLVRRPVTKCR
jgi:hypothetical protein